MSKILEKIKTIGKAWQNVIIDDTEFHDLYRSRLSTCSTCENNVAWICIKCGCPLKAKTRSRYVSKEDGSVEECPISIWADSYHEDESGDLFVIKANLPENLQEYFDMEYIPEKEWIEFLKEKN